MEVVAVLVETNSQYQKDRWKEKWALLVVALQR
jgi:hypothetical protein